MKALLTTVIRVLIFETILWMIYAVCLGSITFGNESGLIQYSYICLSLIVLVATAIAYKDFA